MRLTATALLLPLFLSPLLPAAAPAAPPAALCELPVKSRRAESPFDSLVRVRCGDQQGSGTVVWTDGKKSVVLTAQHVVDKPAALSVRGNGRTHPAVLLGSEKDADLAALLVDAPLPASPVSGGDPEDGAEVLMVGMTSIWSKGRISGRLVLSGREVFRTSYDESDSGDSGAGVFAGGELVGVHCGKLYDGPNSAGVPHCTGSKPVRAFLKKVFRRDGLVLVPVEPAPAAQAPAAAAPQAPACPPQGCPAPQLPPQFIPPQFAPPQYYSPPSSGPCPGGSCPAPARGPFRRR